MLKVIEVEGKAAGEFLDRITAGTVRKLAVGQGSSGLLLTGQSRMIAQFDLLRITEKLFWLVSPEECASALAENLEKLHFAEDLEIRATRQAVSARPGEGERGKIFSWSADPEGRRWPSGATGFEFFVGSAPVPEDWDFARIGSCMPWPGVDWDSNTPALEAGKLFAIDREKGCYPGQEVVELSLNVGHPARLLQAYEGELPLEKGEKVALVPAGEGLVCSVASRGNTTRAFVRVPWSARESAPANFRKIRE